MENIFDLKLESLGRKTAHTGNPNNCHLFYPEQHCEGITKVTDLKWLNTVL